MGVHLQDPLSHASNGNTMGLILHACDGTRYQVKEKSVNQPVNTTQIINSASLYGCLPHTSTCYFFLWVFHASI